MKIENIKKAFAIITGAQTRRDQEHAEFLKLYHALVVNSTPQIAKDFGRMSLPTIKGKEFNLELTAQDYLWWEQQIRAGHIIEGGLATAKSKIFSRLAHLSNASNMTPDEKAAFIALFSDGSTSAGAPH